MEKRINKQFQNKDLTEKEKRFVKAFVDIAYENMAIEHEIPITREEAYKRYHSDALDLLKDGTYKNIRL